MLLKIHTSSDESPLTPARPAGAAPSIAFQPQNLNGLNPKSLPRVAATGLYVHIPFCFHKCHYCDFYSITRQTPQRMEQFVDRLLREAQHWMDDNTSATLEPRTVFFGGGTPTLLPLEQMQRLIAGLKSRFDFSNCTEWTVEANPATVTLEYCRMLLDSGVNRMSLGAQSFDRAELALLERHHNPDDVPRSLELARAAGFTRLNLDLIYALPGQSLRQWMASLESAIALGTEHLSCYGLTYEPNTAMAVRKRLGQFQAAAPELEIAMLRATRARLQAIGICAYEVSNYARRGEECQHNLLYWTGGSYIGLGPSAASHVEGTRWRNRPHLGEWESAVDRGDLPAVDVETLSPKHRAGELAMLMLRMSSGLNFSDFQRRCGFNARDLFRQTIQDLSRADLIACDEQGIQLTESGLPLADGVAGEFLAAAGS